MGTLVRNEGSLVRGESSYSNEPDPWDNDIPLSFQSVRRESHAKPPSSLRFPRPITLPPILSLRPQTRKTDNDQVPFSPESQHTSPNSRRSVPITRHRVVDENPPKEEVSPDSMKKLFIRREDNKSVQSPPQSKSSVKKSKPARQSAKTWKNKTTGDVDESDMKLKETGHERNENLEDIPPISPISTEGMNNEEDASHRAKSNWLRVRVQRVLRLRRRERA